MAGIQRKNWSGWELGGSGFVEDVFLGISVGNICLGEDILGVGFDVDTEFLAGIFDEAVVMAGEDAGGDEDMVGVFDKDAGVAIVVGVDAGDDDVSRFLTGTFVPDDDSAAEGVSANIGAPGNGGVVGVPADEDSGPSAANTRDAGDFDGLDSTGAGIGGGHKDAVLVAVGEFSADDFAVMTALDEQADAVDLRVAELDLRGVDDA